MNTVTIMAITILLLSIMCVTLLWKDRSKIKNTTPKIFVFGKDMFLEDFISLINTLIGYLMIDLSTEIYNQNHPNEKMSRGLNIYDYLKKPVSEDDLLFIERVINLYPIISVIYAGNGIFKVDINKSAKKIEEYQEQTRTDNYIMPIFNFAMINRNKSIFTFSTIFSNTRVIDSIVENKCLTEKFDNNKGVAKELQSMEFDKEYESKMFHLPDDNVV